MMTWAQPIKDATSGIGRTDPKSLAMTNAEEAWARRSSTVVDLADLGMMIAMEERKEPEDQKAETGTI